MTELPCGLGLVQKWEPDGLAEHRQTKVVIG